MPRPYTLRNAVVTLLLLFLLVLPVYASLAGNLFLVTLFSRIIILAMAATSLNLILGYGGMVSFGHAVYLGMGGYAVGILAYEGTTSGLVQWPLAILVCALFALVVGALSLRTRGVYFIMITLAFAQLAYYFGVGLDRYGADDGLSIRQKSSFAGLIDLSDRVQLYYLSLALLAATIYLTWRIVNSRFGMVLQGSRSNERRMRSIGFPAFRYRLTGFVIAGAVCGLAGALLANHTGFISPATMHWTRSGDLIVMVVLGGMASSFGPLFGAVVLLSLEEALPVAIRAIATPLFGDAAVRVAEYWQILLGPLFLLVVLFARGGIDGLLAGMRRG
jgi:branched-chain amino acid transport system permease protein